MVDNLTTRAVLKDKISSAATDFVNKLDNKVQNFGKAKPTEGDPLNYKVIHKGGALVRSGYDTSTAQVHQLGVGETVTIVELVGRRARIIQPVEGWISTETKDGVQIMRPCTMQRRSAQNEAFEHMFEQKFNRIKGSRGSQGYELDPRCAEFDHRALASDDRSLSPRDRSPDYSDDDRDRRRSNRDDRDRRDRDDRDRRDRDRRDRDRRDQADSSPSEFVPRLAAPGSKGGPSFLPPPPGGGGGGAPAASSSSAGPAGGGDFDLLGVGDASTSQPVTGSSPQQAAAAPFDLFSAAPPAQAPAAPAPVQQPVAGAGGDWAGFQGAGAGPGFQPGGCPGACGGGCPGACGGGCQAMFNPMQSQMQPGAPAAGWGAGQAAPAWGSPQGQPQAAHGMAWGGAPQMGASPVQQQQQQQQPPMGGMAPMGMGQGQMPMQQQQFSPQAQNQNWGAFASAAPAYAAAAPMPAAPMPGAAAPGMSMPGMTFPGMAPSKAASPDEDLMSRAMAGMANMSSEQRRSAQQQQPGAPMGMQSGMPMNMMGSQMR